MAKIVMIVGSWREKSFNRQLAEYIAGAIGNRAEIEFLDYKDVPFMIQDMEFPPPAAVERVRKAVEQAQGLWICSPEYNHNIPGGLKNLLDWLSRPVGNRKNPSVLRDKPFTFSSAAGKSAGGYVRQALKDFAAVPGAKVIFDTGVGVKLGAEEWVSDILPLSEDTKQALDRQIAAFLEEISE